MNVLRTDFRVSPDVVLVRWATFPVFLGIVNSAYEAIGCVSITSQCTSSYARNRYKKIERGCPEMSMFSFAYEILAHKRGEGVLLNSHNLLKFYFYVYYMSMVSDFLTMCAVRCLKYRYKDVNLGQIGFTYHG